MKTLASWMKVRIYLDFTVEVQNPRQIAASCYFYSLRVYIIEYFCQIVEKPKYTEYLLTLFFFTYILYKIRKISLIKPYITSIRMKELIRFNSKLINSVKLHSTAVIINCDSEMKFITW